MKSSANNPMDGYVEEDEFVIGGKEESKVGRSYDIKKRRQYALLNLPTK